MRNENGEAEPLSRKERRRAAELGDIMNAASALFAERGFHNTSVQEVAARAEFSVGKIYSFFKSKEAILEALMDRFIAEMGSRLDEADDPTIPPLERMDRWLKHQFEFVNRHRDLIYIGIRERHKYTRGREREKLDKFVTKATGILDCAVARGAFPPIATHIFAQMLLGAIDNLVLTLGAQEESEDFKRIPDLIMDFMIRPLARLQGGESSEANA